MPVRAVLTLALPTLLLLSPAMASLPADGITLSVSEASLPGEVLLQWAGKEPSYDIYRSSDPVNVIRPTTRAATTVVSQWQDSSPDGEILFYRVASRPTVVDNLHVSAGEVAGFMETDRLLPDLVPYGPQSINPAQFLNMASKTILALGSDDLFPSVNPPPNLELPTRPYTGITVDGSFYDTAFTRDEYLAFFRQIDDDFALTGAYPDSMIDAASGAEVRFAEMVYWAASVLRGHDLFGPLPELQDRYLITYENLVPWRIPAGYEDYTAALSSRGTLPFFPNHPRRYHVSSNHQYRLYRKAMDIIGNIKNAYRAGEAIFDWTLDMWLNVVGYTIGDWQFHGDHDGWIWANYFFHSSAGPRHVNAHLMQAIGIPASNSGAAYFSNRGWINIDSHALYGSDPLDNDFYYDDIPPPKKLMPYPSTSHDFMQGIERVSARLPVAPAAGERKLLFVNPSDVATYGAEYVLDHAGDVDVLVLTVRTVRGYLYYGGTGWPEREQYDALGPLLAEAHGRGKEVWALFSTLADRITGAERSDWTQKLNEDGTYPNINISPCVQEYRDRLTGLLQALATGYAIDGVVLDNLFFANLFDNTDTVGHPECPTGTSWMPGQITGLASDLVAALHGVRPGLHTVLPTFPMGTENRYGGLASVDLGHQDLADLAGVVDEVLLVVPGTYWVPQDPPWFLQVVDDLRALTGRDPLLSFQLTDEWEYGPLFFRGILQMVRESDVAGFGLHTMLSGMGEFSPALTPSQWEKVRAMVLRR